MSDRVRERRKAQGKWTVERLSDERGRDETVRAHCCNGRPVQAKECVRVTPPLRAILERVRSEYPFIERRTKVDFDTDYLCSACVRNLKRRWSVLGDRAVLDEPAYRAAVGAPDEVVEKGREAVAMRPAHRRDEVLPETVEELGERIGYEHRFPNP